MNITVFLSCFFFGLLFQGIQESHGCERDMTNCGQTILQASWASFDFKNVVAHFCKEFDTSVACFSDALTKTCKKPMTKAKARLVNLTKEYKKECAIPQIPSKEQIESCDFKGYADCIAKLDANAPINDIVTKEICLSVGYYMGCAVDFNKGCKVNILNQVMNVISYGVTTYEDQCIAKGYPTIPRIQLETSPSHWIGQATREINVSCQVNAEKDNHKTFIIMIYKDKKENLISEVQGNLVWKANDHYKAEGKIDNVSFKSYLNLTVTSPGRNDTGEYNCLVLSFQKNGDVEQESASTNLTWKETADDKLAILEEKLNDLAKMTTSVISALDAKISVLESENKHRTSEISSLKAENQNLLSKISFLETENSKQTGDISSLKAEGIQQDTEITSLKASGEQYGIDISSLKADNQNQTGNIDELRTKYLKHSNLLTIIDLGLSSLKDLQNSPVAFKADKQYKDGKTGIITFWPTNSIYHYFIKGEAFDPLRGVFTAPTNGLYAFNVFVQLSSTNEVKACIRHNGDIVGWAGANNIGDIENSSHSTILKMSAGDTVDIDVKTWREKNKMVYFFFNGFRVAKF